MSLIIGSYAVLFASLAAHAAQFGFLVFFENPRKSSNNGLLRSINRLHLLRTADIERTYGQRKLLAQRTPFVPAASRKTADNDTPVKDHIRSASLSSTMSLDSTTPSATEGESATETDGPVTDSDSGTENEARSLTRRRKTRADSDTRLSTLSTFGTNVSRDKSPVSQHDLFNRYFRKDVVLFYNLDPLRYVWPRHQIDVILLYMDQFTNRLTNLVQRIFSSSWLYPTFSWPLLSHLSLTAQLSHCTPLMPSPG